MLVQYGKPLAIPVGRFVHGFKLVAATEALEEDIQDAIDSKNLPLARTLVDAASNMAFQAELILSTYH